MAADEPPKPPYFLIFATSEVSEHPLTIAADERAAIPLFGSERQAKDFLSSTGFGGDWRPVQVSPEQLVSVLEAHRGIVEYVAHDPPPAGESGMKIRMGKLPELSDALRERARSEMGLFDIGGPSQN